MPILNWLNKEQAVTTARNCPYRLLEEMPELSYGEKNTDNMLIQGDNLEALKALIPTHAGRIKCIFIDPPYNTKSAFEHYDDNLEHSKWLTMIYPRLELLHQLLAEDGSIWITLDDSESHYMKIICDELFGRANFIANSIWQKKYTISNDAKWLSDSHDHLIIYAKNKEIWRPYPLERTADMDKRYTNPDKHPKGVWKSTPLYAKRKASEKELEFTYTFKNGYEWTPPLGNSPRFPEYKLKEMDDNNEIWFGVKGDAGPSRKTFLNELKKSGTPSSTIWLHSEAGHNHEAREEVKSFDKADAFSTPKPERLIKRVFDLATKSGDLVLDSFLGSGTTAAVAQKMNRKFIGIELGDHAVTHCQPRSQKVVDGEQGGISKKVNWQGGGGFKFYRLGEVIFNENGSLKEGISFDALAAHIWYGDTRNPLEQKEKSPLLGVHNGVAFYLLYNGILGDKRPDGGNVLTSKVLAILPEHPLDSENGKKVIYGETSRMGEARLKSENIIFKQIPYDVRGR
ncbi:MAG: site-specific DNA-methyltransferase [Colwellia sp.]|jgi:Adenine specific DNA methylase Mod